MIPASTKKLIEDWRLGFIATIDPQGRPNLSPKGTFLVLDDLRIAFAEMRSPNTVRNIAHQPEIEVNFIDMLSRKGARLRGQARFIEKGAAEYDALYPRFAEHWADLGALFNGFVVIEISDCKPLSSPAYDMGAEEQALRDSYIEKFNALHGGETSA